MKKLSRVLMFISAFTIPICSFAQKKVQNISSEQHQIRRHIRIFSDDYSILRFELYNYD
jgi:hypothetical protein